MFSSFLAGWDAGLHGFHKKQVRNLEESWMLRGGLIIECALALAQAVR